MEIFRVLSNNAAIVVDASGEQTIVLGKGIAYGRRPGDAVQGTVDQVFVPDSTLPVERLAAYLSDLPLEVVRVARLIAERAHDQLQVRVTQALILPIADHLAYAVERAAKGIAVDYPLRWEVQQLYPRELALAREAVTLTNTRLGSALPIDEAVPLTLHLVNAQFSTVGLADTMQMTARINQVLHVVRATFGITLAPESMDVARFVTHLRYLFVRMQSHRQLADAPAALRNAIEVSHQREHASARRIRTLLEMGGTRLTDDEVLYLTLHIARLVAAAKEE